MSTLTVSFVIPCHKLAHLLGACIKSILSQTYTALEIVVMDDCSPDNTEEVVQAFRDTRIRYVRNAKNLGHLRNYNKGIELTRGKYVWLISADDYLRCNYILQRYVELMEQHPNIGYTFCPGVGVRNDRETKVLAYSVHGSCDEIFDGRAFLPTLLNGNRVLAASVMVRRECYEKFGQFPLDSVWAGDPVEMGWAGDWYLWCLFALFYDVGYFAEPMVCYREHDLSMSAAITREEIIASCAAADVAIPWLIKQKATELIMGDISDACLRAIGQEYARQLSSKQYRSSFIRLSMEQFENSLCRSTQDQRERDMIRAHAFAGVADRSYHSGDRVAARQFYVRSLQLYPWAPKLYAKLLRVWTVGIGQTLRTGFTSSTRSTRTRP